MHRDISLCAQPLIERELGALSHAAKSLDASEIGEIIFGHLCSELCARTESCMVCIKLCMVCMFLYWLHDVYRYVCILCIYVYTCWDASYVHV